ncbi:MAG: tyrosine-type recombinase/integrase [Sporichthyaceae bacterium]
MTRPEHPLLATWSTYMRAGGMADRTIVERVSTIRLVERTVGVDPVAFSADDLATWLARYGPNSKRTMYGVVKAWHRWLVLQGHRIDDPTMLLRVPKKPRHEPRPISTRDLEALLGQADGLVRAIVVLAAYAGLRVHEIAKIRGEDFDVEDLTVVGKGGVSAQVALHPMVRDLAASMPHNGYWFPSKVNAGRPVSRHWVMNRFADCAEAAGVNATLHQLRHWCATTMLREGADLRTVQTTLRHASVATTQTYTQVADSTRHTGIRRLPMVGPQSAGVPADDCPVVAPAAGTPVAESSSDHRANREDGPPPAVNDCAESTSSVVTPTWPGEHAAGLAGGYVYCSECGPLDEDEVVWMPLVRGGRAPICPRWAPQPVTVDALSTFACPSWCDQTLHGWYSDGSFDGDRHSRAVEPGIGILSRDDSASLGAVRVYFAAAAGSDHELMTPADARRLAAGLLNAADAADAADAAEAS